MQNRILGNTGISVSTLAFGCVEIGMPYGLGASGQTEMPGEEEAIALLDMAHARGVNFYDTAPGYGVSETLLGKAFAAKRGQVVIATKCLALQKADGTMPGYNALRQLIHHSLQASLRALQTDYVDVFMLHQGTEPVLQNEDVRSIFADLRQSGLIRATGASVYTNAQTELVLTTGGWDVIQLPFNLLDQRQALLFDRLQQQGIGLVIRSVLLRGLLTGKGANLHPALHAVEAHIEKCRQLANNLRMNLSTLAPRFVLSYPAVSSMLVGIDKMAYLDESIDAVFGDRLDASAFQQAQKMAFPEPEFIDLPKWDRAGWLS